MVSNDNDNDLAAMAIDTLAPVIIDLLTGYVPNDRQGLKEKSEAQIVLVGLGNFAASRGREDLRAKLYELSDQTGGRAKV